MELRDIPGAEYIPRFAYFPAGLLRLFVICLLPLCVPVLIGHDIRSIFVLPAASQRLFCLKKKILNFNVWQRAILPLRYITQQE